MDEQSTHQAQPEPQVDSPDSKRSVGLGWVLWPVVALLLYALSVGPALKLASSGAIPLNPVMSIYSPLFSSGRAFHPAQQCLDWYLAKWHVVSLETPSGSTSL